MPTVSEVEAYIRQAAARRGIDPGLAVRLAKTEGLAPGARQSSAYRNGAREPWQQRAGDGPSWADRLAAAGRAFDQAANEHTAPRIDNPFGGDARTTGDRLLRLLQNPRALAEALLARRMG